MSLRPTIDVATVKTRSIVYQNPDGTFPAIGGVLTMGDYTGHAAWTQDPYLNSVTLAGGVVTYDGSDLLLNGVPIGGGGGVTTVSGGDNISVSGTATNPVVNLDVQKDISMNKHEINDCKGISIVSGSGFGTAGRISNTSTDLQMDKSLVISGGTYGRLILKGASAPPDQASLTYQDGVDTLYIAARNIDLTATSAVGGVGRININGELDICGSAGAVGQVLTSQGVGAPPVWSNAALLGRYWTSVSGEITIDSGLFPSLSGATGAVRMRVDIMGGGGGGGGGEQGADGSGGGGGQGFNKTGVITHPIGAPVYISIGVGGAGGIGGAIFSPPTDGTDGGSTVLKTSITGRTLMPIAGGGGGGRGPNPTNVGGDGFVSGEDGSSGASPGGNGGGYYGGASEQNGGIGGDTTSGTGCGGGGGGSSFGNPGGDGGEGDCGYCLIEILEVV